MSYVPPHKRVSKTRDAPPPMPAQMIRKSLGLKKSSGRGSDRRTDMGTSFASRIVYANNSTSRWLTVPSMNNVQLPSSLCLNPVCLEFGGQKPGEKQFTLANGSLQEHRDIKSCDVENMWAPIVETVHEDLLSAFESLKNKPLDQHMEETIPKIVARFGKVLFHWNPKTDLDFVKENSVSESYLKELRKTFYTNVPKDYVEYIKNMVVLDFGIQSEEEKELFIVKLADVKQPDSTISCKCRIKKDEMKLELYKIESNPVRHLVEDISCLEGNVDLRLALCTKKNLIALPDEKMQHIRDLISSAILDPNVKGGLRWPLGKANSGGQYYVVAIWHTKTEIYNGSLMRFRLREADRFDFLSATGEITREVVLMLKGLTKTLEQGCESGSIMAMLEDALKLIQNHFLAWDGSLVSCSES